MPRTQDRKRDVHDLLTCWVLLALLCAGCERAADVPPFECVAQQGTPGGGGGLAVDVGAGQETDESEWDDEEGGDGPAEGFAADGPYDADRGFGWLGEAEVGAKATWMADIFPVGTHGPENPWSDLDGYHRQIAPYLTWVTGLSGYRVDVPDGLYRVTLMFIEPSFPEPGLRVFDVSAGGEMLLDDLDLAARAGQEQPVEIALHVLATDGRLQLDFIPRTEQLPVLAGLRIEPADDRDAVAVSGLESLAGAGEGLLRWDRPGESLRGWVVARAIDGGPFEGISEQLALTPGWIDHQRTAGESQAWRVWPVAADCRAGDPVDSASIGVLDPADLGLPVVDVTVDAAAFASIHLDPAADVEVAASIRCGEESATGMLRLRGQSTRWLPKRSFNVRFDAGTVDGRDRLKLLAEANPESRLWQLLAYGLFQRLDAPASVARPVLLRINGRVYGVYDDIEHVGDDLLESRGYGVDDRFRVGYVDYGLGEDGAVSLEGFEKKENEADPSPELEALLVWLNTAPEHEFEAHLDSYLDVDLMTEYVAGQILIANPEVVDGAHYLVLDPDRGSFFQVPWDHNNDTWTRAEQDLAANTTFAALGGFQYWLWTRLFASPSFRSGLADRLGELAAAELGPPLHADIDALEQQLVPALQVEPYLFTRRYEDWAGSGPDTIRQFVDDRAAFIADALPSLSGLGETGLVITAITPASVEIENRGTSEVELAGCHLSDQVYELAVLPLELYVGIDAGDRLNIETDLANPAGGYLLLSCGVGAWEDDAARATRDDEDDEWWDEPTADLSSLVFHPPLAGGQTYRRTGNSWQLE
jgi:spore coat protein H